MEKLEMQTKNLAYEKFKKLKEPFPNSITEIIDENGKIVRAIDNDILTQEILTHVVGYVDKILGVIINEDKKIWTKSNIDEACIKCNQVLSCLNIACRKLHAVDGLKFNACLCKIKKEEC